jgi:deoxyribodipyrimidine photo-lyase
LVKTLVWFREDLRVADNPALSQACARGLVEAVFLLAGKQWRAHGLGSRRVAFMLRSLQALADELAGLGVPLHVVHADRFEDAASAIVGLAKRIGANAVAFNAEYPLNERRRDSAVTSALDESAIACHVSHGTVMRDPASLRTGADKPYSVYTPFRNRWFAGLSVEALRPLPAPQPIGAPLPPVQVPVGGMDAAVEQGLWVAGERQALRVLDRFVRTRSASYAQRRDCPAQTGTSVLSPYLAVGAISPRQCAWALSRSENLEESAWMNELIWREFYRHVIASFDHVSQGQAFRRQYDALAWERDPEGFEAWCRGETGYPLVDAGMRQLNATGWMHNRVRMVTAMFLSKHLLIDWRMGERFFMQQLVDGDFASNNGGWQWSASTGTDAAPYFRIFNPTAQAKKFDPQAEYIKRWVPELADLPPKRITAGDCAGAGYPAPIVEHTFARQRAIERFKAL